MTSRECFVYMTLPGQTEQVPAGKFVLETNAQGQALGRFVYGKSYLARNDAVPLEPLDLQLNEKTFETTMLNGVFGAIRDASPDWWGRELINRFFGGQPDEIDYLLQSPDDRIGALGFGLNVTPPAPKRDFNQLLNLETLQSEAHNIIADQDATPSEYTKQVEKLMLVGTSMGGARPKAVVETDNALWVAKFNSPKDRWNNARVEHAMLALAKQCGISVADSRIESVAGNDVLLVKRFDREHTDNGYLRYRMISGLTALRTDDMAQNRSNWSYITLAETLRKFCSNAKSDANELFRRMVFNALITNNDDHPRNHAFVAKNTQWHLSPAYDLTPAPVISTTERDLALECGKYGRIANRKNLLSEAQRFLLSQDEAEQIIDEMYNIVNSSWYSVARASGVSEQDCEKIKTAFCYDGFHLDR